MLRATAAGVAVLVAAVGCAHGSGADRAQVEAERDGKVDARLVRLGADEPDREVGVLVRLAVEPGRAELDRLVESGLVLGTRVGVVVTGRIRAGDAVRLGRLSIVTYVELAGEARVPRPPGGAR